MGQAPTGPRARVYRTRLRRYSSGSLLPAGGRNAPVVNGRTVREAPSVVYRQGRKHPCVFSSVASAYAHFLTREEAAPLLEPKGSQRTQWAKDVQKLCKGPTYKSAAELYGPDSHVFNTCLASFNTCLASSS